jgi:maltose O-acetyltransferase
MIKDRMGNALTLSQAGQKVINRIFSYLLDFELMLLRWVGYFPFHHLRRLIYRLAGMKIGHSSSIHMFANFYQPNNITIGKDTVIGIGSFIDGREKVSIGDHVDIASEVMIYNSHHDIDSEDFGPVSAPVTIKDYVFIGPRAIILPGVTLEKGAVVGAGAVVTKDVGALTIVGGVPASPIRRRKLKKLTYKVGRARWFQ